MTSLQFNEGGPSILYSRFQKSKKTPTLIKLLVDKGIAKDEKQAQRILLVLIIIVVIASLYLIHISLAAPVLRSIPKN